MYTYYGLVPLFNSPTSRVSSPLNIGPGRSIKSYPFIWKRSKCSCFCPSFVREILQVLHGVTFWSHKKCCHNDRKIKPFQNNMSIYLQAPAIYLNSLERPFGLQMALQSFHRPKIIFYFSQGERWSLLMRPVNRDGPVSKRWSHRYFSCKNFDVDMRSWAIWTLHPGYR